MATVEESSVTTKPVPTSEGKTGAVPTGAVPTGEGAGRTQRGGLRALLIRLHFYAGVLVGPFLLVVAASGFLYALAPTIENAIYRETLFVDSDSSTTVPISDQVAAARQRQPDGTLLAVRPAPGPGDTTRVLFGVPGLGESERLAVFVNPANAEVTGEIVAYGSSGALPFRTWLSQLHRSLHLGEPGRIYSELAASWLWVIALAGLVLWFTARRNGSRWKPERSGSARRRTLSWHGALGTWVILAMLFLSATGLTWSRFAGENVGELKAALDWTTPTVSTKVDASGHGGHEGHNLPNGADPVVTSWDQSLAAARSAQLDGPVEIAAPKKAGTTFVVQEIGKQWPTQADSVAVDPATGKVIDVLRFDDYPLAAKLSRWGIDGHMGLLFGLPNQLLLAMVAGVIVAMVIWGYRMWWQRRPTPGACLPVRPAGPSRYLARRTGPGAGGAGGGRRRSRHVPAVVRRDLAGLPGPGPPGRPVSRPFAGVGRRAGGRAVGMTALLV